MPVTKALEEARVATQFKKGNKVSPGRPKADKSIKYYMIAMRNCSFEEWGAIIRQAVDDALSNEDGRIRQSARKWLGDYLMGPPVRKSEVTGNLVVSTVDLTEEQRLDRINALIDAAMNKRDANVVNVTPDDGD